MRDSNILANQIAVPQTMEPVEQKVDLDTRETMRRSGNFGAPSSPSSSDRSVSPPRRAKKRARHMVTSPPPSGSRWRESRSVNGQVVLSLASSDESDEDDAKTGGLRLEPTTGRHKMTSWPVVVTPRETTGPVIYDVDDSDEEEEDDDEVEVVERVSPSDEVGTTAADGSEEDSDGDSENYEEEESEEDGEEEEWQPDEETEETHRSEEPEEDDEEEDDEEEDECVVGMETSSPVVERPRSPSSAPQVNMNATTGPTTREDEAVKEEPLFSEKIEPVVHVQAASATHVTVEFAPELVFVKREPLVEVTHSPLVSFSQNEVEAPPKRARHHHRHPRAARRSTVRRRRLDPNRAGMLLFDGPQYVPSAGVVKTLIDFIARSVGPMTGRERHWVDYVLLAKLNNSVAVLSTEVFARHSEWMKITLGASDDNNRGKHHVQREPLMTLPVSYTVRPTHLIMPKSASTGKTKEKNSVEKQHNDAKWLEKRAAELQSGNKRIKPETPRRRVSVGVPQNNGPFSPRSSTTSSVASRSRRTPRGNPATPDQKRRRVLFESHTTNGMYSPSTASTTSVWPSAELVDLAEQETLRGRNRSMPNEWNSDDVHAVPPSIRPASMNPLYTMPLTELKAHINSVRRDGHARNFERPLEIIQKLMNHPRNRDTFNSPVDPVALNLPTYFDIIKNPMDLGTIKIRLEEAAYMEQDDFVADVRLVFENAMRFNAPNHSVHVDASVLLHVFEDLLQGDARRRPTKRRTPTNSSDRHGCRVCLGRSCVMCDQGCLEFALPHLQCMGSCGVDIRKGSIYFITRDGTRVWCAKCRSRHVKTTYGLADDGSEGANAQMEDHSQDGKTKKKKKSRRTPSGMSTENETGIDTIEIPGELIKKKCDVDVEPWIKCGRCFRWLHQICGLYNPVYGAYTSENEYQCPLCVWKLRSPAPPLSASSHGGVVSILNAANELPEQTYESSCHRMPTCELSIFIEEFLKRGLRDMGEVQAAEELKVRVLAFPHERVVVSDRLVKTFDDNAMILEHLCMNGQSNGPQPHRFPSEIAYTSRGIYLFQRHEGVDVALFTLFVQEFGDDCQLKANRRSVYVAYLDSIRYLTPPSARTASYHLIMMAYFDYVRRNGFERVHIWSCPPQKRVSYVFWCRPAFQKTPSAEHLRAWYRRLLTKSKDAGIVKSWTTMYDQYFSPVVSTSNGTINVNHDSVTDASSTVATRGTAARSIDPADHRWPTPQLPPLFDGDFLPAELERILGRLAARNGKYRRGSSGGKSGAVGSTGGKLAVGEFVARIKEETLASAPAPQVEFKAREIFDRCQHAVQRLKNDLLVVDLVVDPSTSKLPAAHRNVPPWWTQVPRFFGSRFMFHQLCSTATYQFDTLRRAKHSTMMMLHHFKNESVPQLNVFCSECFLLISHATFWHCRQCPRFALCDLCHRRDGHSHAHALEFGRGMWPSIVPALTGDET